jgi:predicted permease
MTILFNVVLPVLLVAGVAALAQSYLRVDIRSISRVAFYLFSPALVFDSLANSSVGGAEFAQIAATLLLTTLVLWVVGTVAARLLRLEGPTRSSFLMALLLMNAGNYGLPATLFAFGEEGLSRAALGARRRPGWPCAGWPGSLSPMPPCWGWSSTCFT